MDAVHSSQRPPRSGTTVTDTKWPDESGGTVDILAIDGIDGSGKSTVARAVIAALSSRGIRAATADRSGPAAQVAVDGLTTMIKRSDGRLEILDRRAEALVRGARAWQRLAARRQGEILVLDRWLVSDLGSISEDAFEAHRAVFEGLIRTTSRGLTILLDAPFEVTWSRVSSRPWSDMSPKEQLGREANRRVHQEIETGAARFADCGGVLVRVDARQPADRVIDTVLALLARGGVEGVVDPR